MKNVDWFFIVSLAIFTYIPAGWLVGAGLKKGGGKLFRDFWKRRIKYMTRTGFALLCGWAMVMYYCFVIPSAMTGIQMTNKYFSFSFSPRLELGVAFLAILIFILLGLAAIEYFWSGNGSKNTIDSPK